VADRRSELRGAAHRHDGQAVVAALTGEGMADDVLQLAGDALTIALVQHVGGADTLAAACMERLRRRDWPGDNLLVAQLAAALGSGPVPMLRRLAVDLDELSGILEGDPTHSGGRVDRQNGEVWHTAAIDYARETGEENDTVTDDPDRWLWVEPQGSRDSYRDMETFIGTITDPAHAQRLDTALRWRGPSDGSKTPSRPGPTNWTAGTSGPKNDVSAEPANGSPTPATHPDNRSPHNCHRPSRAASICRFPPVEGAYLEAGLGSLGGDSQVRSDVHALTRRRREQGSVTAFAPDHPTGSHRSEQRHDPLVIGSRANVCSSTLNPFSDSRPSDTLPLLGTPLRLSRGM
jgi:hypothetical protein